MEMQSQKRRKKNYLHRLNRKFRPILHKLRTILSIKSNAKRNDDLGEIYSLNRKYASDNVARSIRNLTDNHLSEFVSDLKSLIDTKQNIVIGPWIGELGYELLYWIPFLRYLKTQSVFENKTCTVISRGGMQLWYKDFSTDYIDIFDHYTKDEFTELRSNFYAQFYSNKNSMYSSLESKVLERTNIESDFLLTQSTMFSFFNQFIKGMGKRTPQSLFSSCLHINSLEISDSDLPPTFNLPISYVVTNFYTRPSFEPDEHEKILINEFLIDLSRRETIVRLDEHETYDNEHYNLSEIYRGVTTISLPEVSPSENLFIKSICIDRAKTYYGTYGGPSYLAIINQTPTVVFSTNYHSLNPIHETIVREYVRRNGLSWVHTLIKDLYIFGQYTK